MKIKKETIKKTLVIGILILFLGTIITPSIAGDNGNQDATTITFYTFDKTGTKKCKTDLPNEISKEISEIFEYLKKGITGNPFSDETQLLKHDFVDLLGDYGLIPKKVSKDYLISLLNPKWLRNNVDKNPLDMDIIPRSTTLNDVFPMQSSVSGSAFLCSMAGGGSGIMFPPIIFPRPRLATVWTAYLDAVTIASNLYTGHGFAAFGPQVGFALGFWGIGLSFAFPGEPAVFGFGGYALAAYVRAEDIETYPPNQVPIISEELPSDGSVNVPNGLSELSFRISDGDGDRMDYTVTTSPYIGAGSGSNVGGGTYSIPVSGLNSNTLYSWHVVVSDDEDITERTFSFRTAVEAPYVSDPLPVDGDDWVSADVSELSFRLEDLQGDLMDYSVETVPDIGSGSGTGVDDGVYSVSVDGLEYTRDYSWFVNVTDGEFWTRRVFGFKTQPLMVFDPFDEGWLYRKQITINHSQVAGSLSDFPVLVSLVDSDLAGKSQEDGDDILFMDGSGVASRLFHEIELFVDSSGELVAWVNVPSLSPSEDSVLYLYYGNSGCGSQEYPDRVWDSDFIHVWHLGDSLVDSAGSDGGSNHGTDIVSGKIGRARDFEQIEKDYIDLGDMDQPADSSITTMTWEAWTKPKSQDVVIMSKYDSSGTDYSTYVLRFVEGGKFKIQANSQWDWPGRTRGITDNSYSVVDQWIYLTGTYELGNVQNLDAFINGDEVSLNQDYSNADYMWDTPATDNLGRLRKETVTEYSNAVIDEVRWSKIVRSDDWIKTSFNTMNDPSSFFIIGPEESGP